jgi:hypothetical protein
VITVERIGAGLKGIILNGAIDRFRTSIKTTGFTLQPSAGVFIMALRKVSQAPLKILRICQPKDGSLD